MDTFDGILLATLFYCLFMILVNTDWNSKDKRSIDQMIKDYKTSH